MLLNDALQESIHIKYMLQNGNTDASATDKSLACDTV